MAHGLEVGNGQQGLGPQAKGLFLHFCVYALPCGGLRTRGDQGLCTEGVTEAQASPLWVPRDYGPVPEAGPRLPLEPRSLLSTIISQ